jgi:hypothetical protein
MSRINYHRKDTWKFRKPVSTRPSKVMDETKYERRQVKQTLHNLLKEITNDSSCK